VHCIRDQEWKLRVAQGTEGEIYINDRTTGARRSAWLQHPELYNIVRDPAESYDVANIHPEIVARLLRDLEEQIPSFPPPVIEAYAHLKQAKGDISTPPGASPRPLGAPLSPGSWSPQIVGEPPLERNLRTGAIFLQVFTCRRANGVHRCSNAS